MKLANHFLASFILLAVLLAGCGDSQVQSPTASLTPTPGETEIPVALTSTISPTLEPSPTSEVSPTPTATATQTSISGKSHYLLDVSFDYTSHTLSVEEQITFTNTSTEAYPNLEFNADPNIIYGVFSLKAVTLGENQAVTGYTLEDNRLTIPLDQPILPGEDGKVTFSFELDLPSIVETSTAVKPAVFGYSERQINLVDWYIYLPVYQPGQGWIIHEPSLYGEYQVYPLADFDVAIALVNPPSGLQIAAPALVQEDNGVSRYQLTDARTFAWSASPLYKVKIKIAGPYEVMSYYFPLYDNAAEMVLQNTMDALLLYSDLFGPYQHEVLTVIEADFMDGMEYDGLYFLSKGFYNLYDGTAKGYLTMIAVHETSHQWWFAQVGNDQALEPWLDEAMATFSERIFYQNAYPDLVDWWQNYRVDFYTPVGYINQTVYAYKGYLKYRNAVYLRGEEFLQDLRLQIGDDAFFAFLKDYALTEKFKIATTADFFTILAAHTDQDLTALKAEYFQ